MDIQITADEIAEIKAHNSIAEMVHNESMRQHRQHKKDEVTLKDHRAELMRQVREVDEQIRLKHTQAWEAQNDAYEAIRGRLCLPFDHEPETVKDVGEWSRNLRHRAWATAFTACPTSCHFGGPTGTRDLMLYISLCALAERQNSQVIEGDIPTIVGIAAMDNKTIVGGLKSLRNAGLVLRVDAIRHSPVGEPLLSITDTPAVPLSGIGARFWGGDREHDAFGGRFGIKTIWIRTWIWLYLNPGATRAEIAKKAGPKGQSAYRAIEDMVTKARLVRMEEDGKCYVIEPHATSKRWLADYVDKRGILGSVENRVKRARCPHYLQIKQRGIKPRESQNEPDSRKYYISAERQAEIEAKLDLSEFLETKD